METQTIHCPTCGVELYDVDLEEPDSSADTGRACPNKCGWVSPEQDGEDLVVRVGVCSY